MKNLIQIIVDSQKYFINFLRISIFVVMAWIGGLKAFNTKQMALFLLWQTAR